ncbi:MAG: HAMP domain-containing histidine kinase, partial [Pseudomonadales bacterium]|nr:HAMP domain-containing histidine kinase [Pseudomonadales bacterium]
TIIYGTKHKHNDYSWHQEFEFLNRKLSVSLIPSLTLLKRVSSWQSYTLLIGGLLYVAMLEAVLLSLLTRQHAIQLEVDTKTREIAQAKEEAERASKAKTDFLASMSHELRTPLNAVIGFTHRVITQKNNNLDERNREALQIVEKNANHLLGLINNLLDITKVEKGRLELEYNKTNLNEVLSEAAKHFSLAANQKKNEIIFHSSAQVDGMIEADTTRIRQVIMNLLSNAIKFTSNGTITLSLDTDDTQTGYVIEVKDTGIGIADEDIPKLFSKFQKVGNTSKINPQGTGLGLALSKEIIDLHGGSIKAKSKLHQGTTFTLWLPISPDKKTNV